MADDRRAIQSAARVFLKALQRRSPSAKVAGSFHVEGAGDGISVISRVPGAWATDDNARHPLYGDREHWYNTNQRDRSRTDWSAKAVDEAADRAAEVYADEVMRELGFGDE